jgi:hypothetical protein
MAEALALLEQASVDPLRELVRLAGDAEQRGDLDWGHDKNCA